MGRRPMQPFAVTLLPPEYSPALPPLARRPNPQPPPIPCILWVLPLPARPRIALGSPAKTNPIPPLWTRSPQLAASRRHLLPAPFGRTGPPRPPKSTIYRTKPISARRQNPPAAPNPTYSLGVTSTRPAQDRAQPAQRCRSLTAARISRAPVCGAPVARAWQAALHCALCPLRQGVLAGVPACPGAGLLR